MGVVQEKLKSNDVIQAYFESLIKEVCPIASVWDTDHIDSSSYIISFVLRDTDSKRYDAIEGIITWCKEDETWDDDENERRLYLSDTSGNIGSSAHISPLLLHEENVQNFQKAIENLWEISMRNRVNELREAYLYAFPEAKASLI